MFKKLDWIKRSGELIARPMPWVTFCVTRNASFGNNLIVTINDCEAVMNGRKIATFDNFEEARSRAQDYFEEAAGQILEPQHTK